jgi:hypothetical protein
MLIVGVLIVIQCGFFSFLVGFSMGRSYEREKHKQNAGGES